MDILRRAIVANLQSKGPRAFSGIAATNELMPDGIALHMAGGDLTRLRGGNAPVLWNHDVDSGPIGRVTRLSITASTLAFEAVFASAGISPFIDEKCGLTKDDMVNGVSIGFTVEEGEPINPQRPRDGTRATKWTLYEISLTSIGLDPRAMVTERSIGRSRMRPAANPVDRADAELAIAASAHGETLTVERRALINREARQLGQSAVYRYEWLKAADALANGPAASYLARQADRRRLAP